MILSVLREYIENAFSRKNTNHRENATTLSQIKVLDFSKPLVE